MHYKIKRRYGKQAGQWWVATWESGKESPIPKAAWPAGLSAEFSVEQAREYVKGLNAKARIVAEESSRIKIVSRISKEAEVESAFLPRDVVQHFERLFLHPLLNKERKTKQEKRRLTKTISMWRVVRRMIAFAKTDPADWILAPDSIYSYFLEHPCSADYLKRVLKLASRYGHLYCRIRALPFSELKPPTGDMRMAIQEAFELTAHADKKSLPLLVGHLATLRGALRPDHHNWLCVGFWFGLRPEEVDLLHKPVGEDGWRNWWTEDNDAVLVVWQPKLRRTRKAERYKRIPIFLPQQCEALSIIKSGEFKRPARSACKRFPQGVTLYGVRHGFTLYMDSIDQPMDRVSAWLGHRSIITTERYYRSHGIFKAPVLKAG